MYYLLSYASDAELLDNIIEDTKLNEIAGMIRIWQPIASTLGFEPNDISDIENNTGIKNKEVRMLMRWREKNGREATYGKLVDVLRKHDERGAADAIIKLLRNRKS